MLDPEVDALAVPTHGRRLDACGFVFADSFDTLLRNLGNDYLAAAWERVRTVLQQHNLVVNDLSWGWLHGGETTIPGINWPCASYDDYTILPSDFTGWTSCDLGYNEFWKYSRYEQIDEDLKNGMPPLRCAGTWRSLKWNIAPEDYGLALRLIEELWPEEPSDWFPENVLKHGRDSDGLWKEIAEVLLRRNQQEIDSVFARAREQFTPAGYRVAIKGFRTGAQYLSVMLPES